MDFNLVKQDLSPQKYFAEYQPKSYRRHSCSYRNPKLAKPIFQTGSSLLQISSLYDVKAERRPTPQHSSPKIRSYFEALQNASDQIAIKTYQQKKNVCERLSGETGIYQEKPIPSSQLLQYATKILETHEAKMGKIAEFSGKGHILDNLTKSRLLLKFMQCQAEPHRSRQF